MKETLEQAAVLHANKAIDSHRASRRSFTESLNISFQAGAIWEKEQSKELINLMRQLVLAFDVRYPNAKQLLAGYSNTEAFEKMESMIEQLQD